MTAGRRPLAEARLGGDRPSDPLAAILDHADEATLDRLADLLADRLADRLGADERNGADRWMPAGEAAAYLGLSRHALHRLTAARTIPCSQDGPGARCYFRRSDLDHWRAERSR